MTSLSGGGIDAGHVDVLDLHTGTRSLLLRRGSHARWVASGHIVYATAGTLRAVSFDLAQLKPRGVPDAVVRNVVTTDSSAVNASVADDGTLVYAAGNPVSQSTRRLVWVDREGRETAIPAPARAYTLPRLSPDGRRVAVFIADQQTDVWLFDLERTTLTRVTTSPGVDSFPVWMRDGQRLIFNSQRGGRENLFWQPADVSGTVERLTDSVNGHLPTGLSPDGNAVLFTEMGAPTGFDVMQLTLDGSRTIKPLIQTSFNERNGIVSADGRWLAYEGDDSGRLEIFVAPFAKVDRGQRWQVSTAGGSRPLWSQSGEELFYIDPTGAVMPVGVEPGASWVATTPTQVVKPAYYTTPGNFGRTYDIAPDGRRFLMIKQEPSEAGASPASMIIVYPWFEELKRLVPTR